MPCFRAEDFYASQVEVLKNEQLLAYTFWFIKTLSSTLSWLFCHPPVPLRVTSTSAFFSDAEKATFSTQDILDLMPRSHQEDGQRDVRQLRTRMYGSQKKIWWLF